MSSRRPATSDFIRRRKRPLKPSGVPNELYAKAVLILDSSTENANVLCEVLEMFNQEEKNYTPLLLTVELIFKTFLKRRVMYLVSKEAPTGDDPRVVHTHWLSNNYDLAFDSMLACMSRGEGSSRAQALSSCLRMMIAEGEYPILTEQGNICFPDYRLKDDAVRHKYRCTFYDGACRKVTASRRWAVGTKRNVRKSESIIGVILDDKKLQSFLIRKLAYYNDCRDFQQNALKVLSEWNYNEHKPQSEFYIQNYLELFGMIIEHGLNKEYRPRQPKEYKKKKVYPEDHYCIRSDHWGVSDKFDPDVCKVYMKYCWSTCMKWPLRANQNNHHTALVVLNDRLMQYLTQPTLAADFLCDRLDCDSITCIMALDGILQLVFSHTVDFALVYDRLYGMFEPEMFATRSKRRLIHVTDVFLDSLFVPEAIIASFAKRLSRLALYACPEDAQDLLRLVANMLHRRPGLRTMAKNAPTALLPEDPFQMEESRVNATNATHSSLWEVVALKQHSTPEVCASAAKVLALADSGPGTSPPDLPPLSIEEIVFDGQLKDRVAEIAWTFIPGAAGIYLSDDEEWLRYNFWWIPDLK